MDRDRTILDTAAVVFHEKGFHGAGVDEVGRRAGLSGPTLYRHFSGKDEILATLVNEVLDELVSATAMVHEDPFRDLERVIRHHVAYATGRRQLVDLYQCEDRSLVDPWKRHFAHRRRQYTARWEALVARCAPAAAPEAVSVATQSTLGLIFSIARWPPAVTGPSTVSDLVVGYVRAGLSTLH